MACTQEPGHKILSGGFRADPIKAGWRLDRRPGDSKPGQGGWIKAADSPHAHSLRVVDGYWKSPVFKTAPHSYYRLTFQSKAQLPGHWAVMFYDADGRLLEADHNSWLEVTDKWLVNEFFFQGKEDAVSARLWFYPVAPSAGKAVYIREVALAAATGEQVLAWADRVYATLPPVTYKPPADRWGRIPRAMETLRSGKPLRIVLLGDSIANDAGNSPFDKLIQRRYPGSEVTVITSVRGGKGCQFYQKRNRVQEYVVRYRPDLVIITGISHGHDVNPIRSVVRQIRAGCDAEIMLTTGPIAQDKEIIRDWAQRQHMSIPKAAALRQDFLRNIKALATDEKLEFIPLRRLWNEYMAVATNEHDVTWFMRDVTHANYRGRQVVGRMLERYFAPDMKKDDQTRIGDRVPG
ncbi:MAG: SGNH/GDSL hydrolase family protein, partial [Lentisphaerae bacterium]|nr:SGNH/GDSL hydrolase family protein [Lentisphaerota bacterium]